jgi:carbon monoxide dehydrogenase subunit G
MDYQHQVFIERPASAVFAYMDDVSREHEWQPNIQDARKDPPGETTVGTRKTYVSEFMGRRIENTYVTAVFEGDRRAVYETTPDSVLRARAELLWEPEAGGTRVTMKFRGKATGPLRFVPARVLEGVYKKELENTLGLLKKRLESGA